MRVARASVAPQDTSHAMVVDARGPVAIAEIVSFLFYEDCDVCSCVCISWKDNALTMATRRLLDDVYNSSILMAHIDWIPPEQRIERVMNSAKRRGDTQIMDKASFRTLVEIQLALQHKRDGETRNCFPFGEVVNLLVRSVARGWSSRHLWSKSP